MTEIPIVPDGNTAATVTTTVWIGVCIVALFHLRFGWTLSGLVVPGYLVPLLMVRPVSVFVILAEAIVTYWVVHAISEWGKQRPYWCTLFGRDRFFAITVVSVLVRVAMDAYLLPVAGQSFNEVFGVNFRYEDELHSVGLVVVALIANYLWKPGVCRGLSELSITTAATYFVVRYILVEFTSFDIGNLRYVYEDIAASLLASPKAYIILLSTAWLASRMNLRYSWDYNGILIPSLLALQWCDPTKILATLVEAFVILALSHAALKIPVFRRIGMVGARQLILFFTIAFAYRTALVWLVPLVFSELKASDTHGFGYLLSTLLAIRFYAKGQVISVSQAALQVSIGGALAGSLIGFWLLYLPREWHATTAQASLSVVHTTSALGDLASVLRADKLRFYDAVTLEDNRPPDSHHCLVFVQALEKLDLFCRHQDSARFEQAKQLLQRIDYEVIHLDQYLYLRDRRINRNWGAFVLSKDRREGLVIGVPYPISEPFTLEAATTIFEHLGGSAMAIAHNSPLESVEEDLASLHPRSLYATFHEESAGTNAFQVRSYSTATEKWFRNEALFPAASDEEDWTADGMIRLRPTAGALVVRQSPIETRSPRVCGSKVDSRQDWICQSCKVWLLSSSCSGGRVRHPIHFATTHRHDLPRSSYVGRISGSYMPSESSTPTSTRRRARRRAA